MSEQEEQAFDQEIPRQQNGQDPDQVSAAETPGSSSETEGETSSRSSTTRQRKRPRKIEQPVGSGEASPQAVETQETEDEEAMLGELEAKGFTRGEALRLIHVSDQLANSREAREAEAVIRRLRFQRWLMERGLLDEFSA